jgi:hypothetical protein
MQYKLNIVGIPFSEETRSYNYDAPDGTTFQLLERHEDPEDRYIVVFVAAPPDEPN